MIKIKFDISLTIFPKYKLVLVKIFRQLVVTICLLSMLLSSPAVAFASQEIEAHAPKGGLNITDKNIHNGDVFTTKNGDVFTVKDGNIIIIKKHDGSNFSLGAIAGGILGGFGSVSLVSIAGTITGLSAAGISTGLATIGAIVGGGMAAGLVVSAALPVAGVAGGLLVAKSVHDSFTTHQQKSKLSISDRSTGMPDSLSEISNELSIPSIVIDFGKSSRVSGTIH